MEDIIRYYKLCGFTATDVSTWLDLPLMTVWAVYGNTTIHIY